MEQPTFGFQNYFPNRWMALWSEWDEWLGRWM